MSKDMDASERLRARYQHATLKHVTGERMTNASLRERFGIADQNAAQVSRIICKNRDLICRTASDRGGRVALASLPRRRSAALKPGACGAPLRGCGA